MTGNEYAQSCFDHLCLLTYCLLFDIEVMTTIWLKMIMVIVIIIMIIPLLSQVRFMTPIYQIDLLHKKEKIDH